MGRKENEHDRVGEGALECQARPRMLLHTDVTAVMNRGGNHAGALGLHRGNCRLREASPTVGAEAAG